MESDVRVLELAPTVAYWHDILAITSCVTNNYE